MHVGSTKQSTRPVIMARLVEIQKVDENEGVVDPKIAVRFFRIMSVMPEALCRVGIELLGNAADNIITTKRRDKRIRIDGIRCIAAGDEFSIWNDGLSIPVVMHTSTQEELGTESNKKLVDWLPTKVFSSLRFSKSFSKGKGQDSSEPLPSTDLGAKLSNIYSKKFTVEIGDPVNKRSFIQVWTNNMRETSGPQITENYTGISFVKVTAKFDLGLFGYHDDVLPSDFIDSFRFYSNVISYTHSVPVQFNDENINVTSIQQLGEMYYGDRINNSYYHAEKLPGDDSPTLEILLVDNPNVGEKESDSFVNGVHTYMGGIHMDAVYKAFSSVICDRMNGKEKVVVDEKKKKRRTNQQLVLERLTKKKGRETKTTQLTPAQVKANLSGFVIARVLDAEFDSQSKLSLKSHGKDRVVGHDPKSGKEITKPVTEFSITVNKDFYEQTSGWGMYIAFERYLKGRSRIC